MKVTVLTGRWARRYVQQEVTELYLPDNASVEDALERLRIPLEEVGFIVINSRVVPRKTFLHEGDSIRVYPAVIGG